MWLNEMRFSQIEQQPFILRGNYFVTPMVHLRLATDVASENSKRVAMIAIAGDDFENCVAAGEQDRQKQRQGAPEINMASCGLILCSHRRVASQIRVAY